MAATPIEATHSGIAYPGELVRTPTWQAVLGDEMVNFIPTLVSGQNGFADG